MSEVKTEPVAASFVTREAFWDDDMHCNIPGAIYRATGTEDAEAMPAGVEKWYYACACGCGASGSLRVAAGRKPEKSPSWLWNGSLEKPTLTPSVHHVGHWHGFLSDGMWVSC